MSGHKVSGQGAFGDRGCGCSGSLVAVLVAVCLFAGLMVLIDAMPPAPAGPTREQVGP